MTREEPPAPERPEEEPAQDPVQDPAHDRLEDPAAPEVREPHETRTRVEVGLERSVRYGRIIVTAAAVGAVIAAVSALFFPVADDADYELGQIVGLMAVVGAAVGLALGALLALALGISARRRRGAAIAVQTDVR